MSTFDDLARRLDLLIVRYEEALRAQALMARQVEHLTIERDGLKQRLAMARSRIDALIARMPSLPASAAPADAAPADAVAHAAWADTEPPSLVAGRVAPS